MSATGSCRRQVNLSERTYILASRRVDVGLAVLVHETHAAATIDVHPANISQDQGAKQRCLPVRPWLLGARSLILMIVVGQGLVAVRGKSNVDQLLNDKVVPRRELPSRMSKSCREMYVGADNGLHIPQRLRLARGSALARRSQPGGSQ